MTNEECVNELIEIGNVLQIHPNSPKGKALKKAIELLKSVSFPERESGEWIESTYQFCGRTIHCIRCSNCDNPQDHFRTTPFCPCCGAPMKA